MKAAWIITVGALALSLVGCVTASDESTIQQPASPKPGEFHPGASLVTVRMTTTMGDIVLELNREKAPLSVANFLWYADKGEYDGTIFHRVMENFVIQGGGYTKDMRELLSGGTIMNEWQNGLKNVRGSIAMARETAPNSATREFYINVVDNPRLDGPREITGNAGYAVFGRVVEGMDVVDKIRKLPVGTRPDPKGSGDPKQAMANVPLDPPVILRVQQVR